MRANKCISLKLAFWYGVYTTRRAICNFSSKTDILLNALSVPHRKPQESTLLDLVIECFMRVSAVNHTWIFTEMSMLISNITQISSVIYMQTSSPTVARPSPPLKCIQNCFKPSFEGRHTYGYYMILWLGAIEVSFF